LLFWAALISGMGAIDLFRWRNELEDDRAPDRDVQEEVVIAAILRAARAHPRFKAIDQWTIVGWLNEARWHGRGGGEQQQQRGRESGGSVSESIDQGDVRTSSDADSDSDDDEREVEEKEQQAGLRRRGGGGTVEAAAATPAARKRQRQPAAAAVGV
jgi:hypothetical protein